MNKKYIYALVVLFVVLGILFTIKLMPSPSAPALPDRYSIVTPKGEVLKLRDNVFLNLVSGFFVEKVSDSEFLMMADLSQMFENAGGLATEIKIKIHKDVSIISMENGQESTISLDDLRWGDNLILDLFAGQYNTQLFQKTEFMPRQIVRFSPDNFITQPAPLGAEIQN